MTEYAPFKVEDLSTPAGINELNRILGELTTIGDAVALPYGDSASQTGTAYLSTVDGVVMTSTKGYRMHRAGSIVGHSCLVNITTATTGDVTFEVRVNDTNQSSLELEFGSSLGTGVKSDSLAKERNAVSFSEGDIIQVKATETGTMAWTDVIGYVLIRFDS